MPGLFVQYIAQQTKPEKELFAKFMSFNCVFYVLTCVVSFPGAAPAFPHSPCMERRHEYTRKVTRLAMCDLSGYRWVSTTAISLAAGVKDFLPLSSPCQGMPFAAAITVKHDPSTPPPPSALAKPGRTPIKAGSLDFEGLCGLQGDFLRLEKN
jgi:hypothetical protein